ncbi:MAG: topoisomerase protein [Candidatus Woesebacteria bacterium GW2011_GWA1_38_8]|uniref:DNA topoisomerase 1 n=2 Tax=Candidatus Woeseibacteriota TaxID=1752722 RepID=A0A0G0L7D1_9BACT|nr:MAG: topoisomerase protein [Candidatus Woesebacteria bacterium GW2011_GWA1_38_8]
MDLIIVESPTKARTLSRFLGSGYVVEATTGHIKDLPKNKLSIDVEHDFKPDYRVVEKRSETIRKIQTASKKAKNVFIATDPDREGEAIAQHVAEIIKDKHSLRSKDQKDTKILREKTDKNLAVSQYRNIVVSRIVFHEITKNAVEEAIKNPRDVDKNLVHAQTARRVLDRLVGYKLSPLLWKKVRRGLSAGRVQTVCVRLIVEKEREIEAFKSKEYWEIFVNLQTSKTPNEQKNTFEVQLIKINDKKAEIQNKENADKVVSDLKASEYTVLDVVKREVNKSPYPPFTTSTMSQAAARIFGWSSKKTMSVAQALYEEGLITYHRTDSMNISLEAIRKTRDFIKKQYGGEYLPEKPKFYKTSSKVAQEAHEAIRPTSVNSKYELQNSRYEREGEMLYKLIWKRFVACQMTASVYDETTIDVVTEFKKERTEEIKNKYLLRVSGQIMKFDGWKILYVKVDYDKVAVDSSLRHPERSKGSFDADPAQLPDVSKDETLKLLKVIPLQKFTQPPARYTEASLIKVLEKLGIGRPSTYAPTINTIQIRNYVEKNEGKFSPTSVGIAVNDFLIGNFPDVFEYQFTAGMEEGLDKVANGEEKWVELIRDFYKPFEKKLLDVEKKAKRVAIEAEKTGEKCPECKKGDIVIRTGRFGKFLSCDKFPECKYTAKYLDKIGKKCPDCKKGEVIVKKTKKGRKFYGCSRYPKCKWASWRKPS